jgi:tRNA (adenine-N(1)-)-methyltransferase non-catalytic subunit
LPYGCVVEIVDNKNFVRTGDDEITPAFLDEFTGITDTNFSSDGAVSTFGDSSDSVAPMVPIQGKGSNDNRDLRDTSTSQQLDYETIQAMRAGGTGGKDLIKALVDNSSTFQGKTEFSKAKYIKRKAKKYLPRARLVRCSAGICCEILFQKSVQRAMSLREDSLAQILSYANIYAGSQALIFDTLGLPTAAVLERMGGCGRLLSVFTSQDPPHKEILSRFNFNYNDLNVLNWVSGHAIFGSKDVLSAAMNLSDTYNDEKLELLEQGWPVPLQDHTVEHLEKMESDDARLGFLTKRSGRFFRKMTRPGRDETQAWLEKRSDSLIITTKYEPLPVLKALYPCLAPSCPFVIFCEHIEALAECYDWLKEERSGIKIQLSDTWRREYQMLAGRTHPQMSMSAHGGYILTGVKVETGVIQVPKKGKLVGLGVGAQRHANRNTVAKAIKGNQVEQDGEGRAKKQKTQE